MKERRTGVSGAVNTSQQSNSEESVTVTLTNPNADETIYNLIFKDYDEEKDG